MHYIIVVAAGSIAQNGAILNSTLYLLCAFEMCLAFLYYILMRRDEWEKAKNERKKKLVKLTAIFLMLLSVVFISFHLFLALNIANEKLKILEVAQEDVANLRLQNLELVLEKSEIVSMGYIEKEARDKLKYSGEGEVLFVILDELLESEWVENELNLAKGLQIKEEERNAKEIFEIWSDFLFFEGV